MVMDTRFELQYKAVAEFKWSFVFLLEATSNYVDPAGSLCQLLIVMCGGTWAGFTGP